MTPNIPPILPAIPKNAGEIFSKENVDGGLIGGAALKAEDFLGIGKAF
jgi:triosephosphate isomerase